MVTFETKCWENDWEFLLAGNYLDEMIARCKYPFAKKKLFINNVRNLPLVKRFADKKIKQGVIDEYIVVDQMAKEALDFFNIDKDSFKGGYNYSIAELVSIYTCSTPYLLHFSSDSYLPENNNSWIDSALKIFETREDIAVANPTWNFKFNEAKAESFEEIEDFFVGYGFSDQCYLIRTDEFRKPIYNEYHAASARYPAYGGELFEKRVDSYMHNNSRLRITSNNCSYIHRNFPKQLNKRRLLRAKIFFLPISLSLPNTINKH